MKTISVIKRNDLEMIKTYAGSECSARISMMMYYVKPSKATQVKNAILAYAHKLISENLEPGKEEDFNTGKNPFVD